MATNPMPKFGSPLTDREVELLTEVSHGRSNGVIGAKLHLSLHTVKARTQPSPEHQPSEENPVTEPSTTDVETDEKKPPQEFLAFLAANNKGRSATELTDALQGLVEAVTESGKGGKLVYTVNISPAKAEGAVNVTDSIVTKKPVLDRPTSIFFVDDSHNLVRNNPTQPHLFEN